MTKTILFALIGVAAATIPALAQAADAARGATLVKQRCGACHAVVAGKNGMGPSLAGIYGKKAAAVPGFKFSSALTASNLTWTDASLDAYLAAPTKAVKGTSMMIATPAAADRADMIAYIASLK